MVKFLLDKGADVNARVCGNFFTPDDQKESRSDSLDHEWVNVCKETNYEGLVYVSLKIYQCLIWKQDIRVCLRSHIYSMLSTLCK